MGLFQGENDRNLISGGFFVTFHDPKVGFRGGVHINLETDWIRFLENQKEHELSTYHMGNGWGTYVWRAPGLVGVGVGIGAFQIGGAIMSVE